MEMFFLRQGLKAPLVMVPTLVAPSAVKICGTKGKHPCRRHEGRSQAACI